MSAAGHSPRHTLDMEFGTLQSAEPDGYLVILGCLSEQPGNGVTPKGCFERVVLSIHYCTQQPILPKLPRIRVCLA
jgi:hypothetical protein